MKMIEKIKKDNYGLIYSTELLLSIAILFVIIAIIINASVDLNEKTLSAEELSNIEKISVETSDFLLNNPGVPEDWENSIDDEDISKSIIPGLALKTRNVRNGEFRDESDEMEEVVPGVISYMKLLKLSSHYDELANRNLFNNSFITSIAIYPINPSMDSIVMGDDLSHSNKDIVVVNRTVKCDYFSDFVIYSFNDFELEGEKHARTETCNHDNVWNLTSHDNDNNYFWLCRSFRIYKNSMNNYDFYLISPNSIKTADVYYRIENLNNASNNIYRLNEEVIELDDFFNNDLENASNNIYTIHFKVPKQSADEFKSVLVAVPSNMSDDLKNKNQMKYEYFTLQDVDFVMKTSYK